MTAALLTSTLALQAEDAALVPRIDGKFTAPKQQPVDFAIWPAEDGTWQI